MNEIYFLPYFARANTCNHGLVSPAPIIGFSNIISLRLANRNWFLILSQVDVVVLHLFNMATVQFYLQLLLKQQPLFLFLVSLVVQLRMQEFGLSLKDQDTANQHQQSNQGFE